LEMQKTESRAELAHLAVDAGRHDRDFVGETEVFEIIDALPGFLIGTDDGTAFESGEHFRGMKAQYRQIAVGQYAAAMASYAERVCGVVNHLEAVGVRDGADAIHVAGMTVAMHRHDGGRLRSYGRFDLVGVQIERFRVDVDEYRFDAVPQQRMGRRHE